MSNLSELLGISNKDEAAIAVIGDAIGTIADFSGAIDGIASVITAIINSINGSKSKLDSIDIEIKAGFEALGLHIKAEAFSAHIDNLNRIASLGTGSLESTQAALNNNIDKGARVLLIKACRDAIDELKGITVNPSAFSVVFEDQVYFDDKGDHVYLQVQRPADGDPYLKNYDFGYGTVAPSADGNGRVFGYIYSLPLLLYCEAVFLAVGGALLPTFATDYAQPISDDITFLQGIHDKILNEGLKPIVPINFDNTTNSFERWMQLYVGDAYDGTANSGTSGLFENGSPAYLLGLRIDYGAVEVFSGASVAAQYNLSWKDLSVNYSNVRIDRDPSGKDFNFFGIPPIPALRKKFLIRRLSTQKKLYQKIGLPDVLHTIENLQDFGKNKKTSEVLQIRYCDWSLRAACEIVGSDVLNDSGDGFSLNKLRNFIYNTPPQDRPSNSIPDSLREVIT